MDLDGFKTHPRIRSIPKCVSSKHIFASLTNRPLASHLHFSAPTGKAPLTHHTNLPFEKQSPGES
jgi:hypothetical protein